MCAIKIYEQWTMVLQNIPAKDDTKCQLAFIVLQLSSSSPFYKKQASAPLGVKF